MPKRTHDPDPNSSIARVVREMLAPNDPIPPDSEAAWKDWIGRVQRIDERTKQLLRTAFEMGVAAGRRERR